MTQPSRPGLAAVAVLAYALTDLGHETAHAMTTLLPLDVAALSISTVSVESTRSSPVVAAAGVVMNVSMALVALLAFRVLRNPQWRYFAWLLATLNLFNAGGYLLYSPVFDGGDIAVVGRALVPQGDWRLPTAIAGVLAYGGAIWIAQRGLRQLVASGVVSLERVAAACRIPYLAGALLLIAGAGLNPTSHWLILTSGAAVGFGAMAGLMVLPLFVGHETLAVGGSRVDAAEFRWPWLIAGAVVAVVFVGLFGPGITL